MFTQMYNTFSYLLASKRAAGVRANAQNFELHTPEPVVVRSLISKSIRLTANSPFVKGGDMLLLSATGTATLPPVGVFGTTAESILGLVSGGYYNTLAEEIDIPVYLMQDNVRWLMEVKPSVQATITQANYKTFLNKAVTAEQLATPTANGRTQVVDPSVASSNANRFRTHDFLFDASGKAVYAVITILQ